MTNERASAGYDIIGDVHGCADQLEQLLQTMGYTEIDGAYKHPTRQAVFVGDFIDRGPHQVRSVAIPRAMVLAGNAHAVIGNHEFNAASMATKDTTGQWNRAHSERNLDQTAVFRDEAVFGSAQHAEMIEWFMTLPLWLDLDGIRIVHACWHEPSMHILEPWLSETGSLTPELLIEANISGTDAYKAVEVILKGPEAQLDDYTYNDKDGHTRGYGRFTWWNPDATTLRTGVRIASDWQIFDPDRNPIDHLPNTPLPGWLAAITPTDPNRTPVCFGHYWFLTGTDNQDLQVINNKAACVDFSAVKGGPLVAYRWSGEPELTSDNLVATNN